MPGKTTLHLLTKGNLRNISGGYIYNRELVQALTSRDFNVTVHDISSTTVMQQTLTALSAKSCVFVDSIIAEDFAGTYEPSHQSLYVIYLCHLPVGLRPTLTAAEQNQLSTLEHKIIKQAQLVICTSEFTQNWLANRNSHAEYNAKYLVVLPAVNQEFIPSGHANERKGINLLCVANILPAKGQLDVIQALSTVPNKKSWHLHLVAGSDVCDKYYLAQIRTVIRAKNLAQQVSLTFDRIGPELVREYQQADIFVLATRFETYGMALAEARACALPTIVNDVGGVRESTYAPSTIYINRDEPQDLEHALHRLITDRKQLRIMRNHALRGIKQQQSGSHSLSGTKTTYSWNKSIESICEALFC